MSEPEMTCSGKKDEENLLPSRIFVCSFLICSICSYELCQSRSCMILRRARRHPQCGLEESGCTASCVRHETLLIQKQGSLGYPHFLFHGLFSP